MERRSRSILLDCSTRCAGFTKASPPDLELALAPPFRRATEIWFDYCSGMLLGTLSEADPSLHSRLAAVVDSP